MKKYALFLIIIVLFFPQITFANFNYNKSIQNVPLNKVWSVKFNAFVDLKNSDSDSIKVVDEYGNRVNVGLSYGSSEKIVLVTPPNGGYAFNKRYYLIVGANLKSKSGKLIKNPYTLMFNTISQYTGVYNVQVGALSVLKKITIKQTSTRATKYKIDESTSFYKIGETVTVVITNEYTNVYFYADDGSYVGKGVINVKEPASNKTFAIQ